MNKKTLLNASEDGIDNNRRKKGKQVFLYTFFLSFAVHNLKFSKLCFKNLLLQTFEKYVIANNPHSASYQNAETARSSLLLHGQWTWARKCGRAHSVIHTASSSRFQKIFKMFFFLNLFSSSEVTDTAFVKLTQKRKEEKGREREGSTSVKCLSRTFLLCWVRVFLNSQLL